MNLAGIAGVILASMVFGFYVGGRRAPPAPAPVAPPAVAPAPSEKLAGFTSSELEEYAQLKLARAHYEKADELLGKMILILIADLGLHASRATRDFAEQAASRRDDPPSPTWSEPPTPAPVIARPSPPAASAELRADDSGKVADTGKMKLGERSAQSLVEKLKPPLGHALYWRADENNSSDFSFHPLGSENLVNDWRLVLVSERDRAVGIGQAYYELDPKLVAGRAARFTASVDGKSFGTTMVFARVLSPRRNRMHMIGRWDGNIGGRPLNETVRVPIDATSVRFYFTARGNGAMVYLNNPLIEIR